MACRAQHPGNRCRGQPAIVMRTDATRAGHGCGLHQRPCPAQSAIWACFCQTVLINPDHGLSFARMQDHTALTIVGARRD